MEPVLCPKFSLLSTESLEDSEDHEKEKDKAPMVATCFDKTEKPFHERSFKQQHPGKEKRAAEEAEEIEVEGDRGRRRKAPSRGLIFRSLVFTRLPDMERGISTLSLVEVAFVVFVVQLGERKNSIATRENQSAVVLSEA